MRDGSDPFPECSPVRLFFLGVLRVLIVFFASIFLVLPLFVLFSLVYAPLALIMCVSVWFSHCWHAYRKHILRFGKNYNQDGGG